MKEVTKKVPELPLVYKLSTILGGILNCIFIAGIVVLICTTLLIDNQLPEISLFTRLLPGLFLMLCGMLAKPCVVGLAKLAQDPYVYFSRIPTLAVKGQGYDPSYLARHITSIGLILAIMLMYMPSGTMLFGIAFVIAHVVAGVSLALLAYYRKII